VFTDPALAGVTDKAMLRLQTQRLLLSLTSNRIRDAREFVFGFAGARPRVFLGHPFLAVGRNIPYNSSHRD
jgi:hypothetical protein